MCSARRLPHLSWSLPDSLSLSVSKQDFRVSSISLTHSHFLPRLLSSSLLLSHFPFAFRADGEGFFAPQLFLPLSLSLLSALNVPNSRENGRAIETAQQKKVIIKLAPKMTLAGAGVGRTPCLPPNSLPPSLLFWSFFASSSAWKGGFEFPRRRHQIQFVVAAAVASS